MSYILDALKKSEQNRGSESVPNVQTIHSSSLSYQQDKRPVWPWFIVAILIVNIFVLIYFLKPDSNTENIKSVQQPEKTVVELAPAPAPVVTATIPEPVQINTPVINTEPPAPPKQPANNQVFEIEELPAHIRQQIPDMVFSAHVYSSEPIQRSIVINDSFKEEGEALGPNLTLIEITRSGAIFELSGYRFSASVLSGWSTH